MAVLNFPSTAGKPTDGSFTYEENGVTYSWDGVKWVALTNYIDPEHTHDTWHVHVMEFGARGDGSNDDTAALKDAVAYAESITDDTSTDKNWRGRYAVLDLDGKNLKVKSTIEINKGITIQNGSIWAPSDFANTILIDVKVSAQRGTIKNVSLDGGLNGDNTRNARTLLRMRGKRWLIEDCTFVNFSNYGVDIGGTSQEIMMDNCVLREWRYEDAGTADGNLRTAAALYVHNADNLFSNLVLAQSKYPLLLDGGTLNMFNNCHLYNGASTTTTEDYNLLIKNGINNNFTSCYFDNGKIEIEDTFANSFVGCHYHKNTNGTNTNHFVLVNTSDVLDGLGGLDIIGGQYTGMGGEDFVAFDGLFNHPNAIYYLHSVSNAYTGEPAKNTYGKFGPFEIKDEGTILAHNTDSEDGHYFKSTKKIVFHTDYLNNSPIEDSVIKFVHDNDLEGWEFGRDEVYPHADGFGNLGTPSLRLNAVHCRKVRITPAGRDSDPIEGEVIYNNGTNKLEFYNGTTWEEVTSS